MEESIIRDVFSYPVGRFISVISLFALVVCAAAADDRPCTSSCGEIRNISSPFRLHDDPPHCGDLRFNLSCENNATVLYFLRDGQRMEPSKRYLVEAINYNNYTIRVVDPEIRKGNCSTVPAYTPPPLVDNYIYRTRVLLRASHGPTLTIREISQQVIFFICEKPVNSSNYVESPCTFKGTCGFRSSSSAKSGMKYSYYYLIDDGFSSSDLDESCCIEQISLVSTKPMRNSHAFYAAITHGFELSWYLKFDKGRYYECYFTDSSLNKIACRYMCSRDNFKLSLECYFFQFVYYVLFYFILEGRYKYTVGVLTQRVVAGIVFVVGLLIYKWRRRHLSIYEDIEKFLQTHNDLAPISYSYSDIRKMSEGFSHKLGEGGFGTVFKGKLRSGHLVAIKILGKSKGPPNWQDFVNEIATIGRIHHVNVARLVGYCVEGSKRALIFDFMSNGSLDKLLFSGEEIVSLSCEKIFEIAVGIARGIEYLHSGCEMQILHFDIKPHNILLDDNFAAKISDFGLARLCPLENSAVSMTAVRGTIGYIAPELFYKNIGGVSHKADVYSFGMLLMEMANRRRNTIVGSENSDGTYFPIWIHEQFSKGKAVSSIQGVRKNEQKTIEKMLIVALWCIQLKPGNRPSMGTVRKMLEGEVEDLEMPPKPCLYPQENNVAKCSSGATYDATRAWSAAGAAAQASDHNSMEISLIKSFNPQRS